MVCSIGRKGSEGLGLTTTQKFILLLIAIAVIAVIVAIVVFNVTIPSLSDSLIFIQNMFEVR